MLDDATSHSKAASPERITLKFLEVLGRYHETCAHCARHARACVLGNIPPFLNQPRHLAKTLKLGCLFPEKRESGFGHLKRQFSNLGRTQTRMHAQPASKSNAKQSTQRLILLKKLFFLIIPESGYQQINCFDLGRPQKRRIG